jgi:hypothetical protein
MVSKIVDPNGEPINTAVLSEPQTSKLQWLQQRVPGPPVARADAVATRDDPHRCRARRRRRAVPAVRGHGRKRRAHLRGDEQAPPRDHDARFHDRAAANPSAAEKKATDQMRELIADVRRLRGHAVRYDRCDRQRIRVPGNRVGSSAPVLWVPKTITHRPQNWFRIYRGYRQEIRLRDGERVRHAAQSVRLDRAHASRRRAAISNAPHCSACWCGRTCSRTTPSRTSPSFWRSTAFRCASANIRPAPIDKEKATLLRALVGLGHNAAGIMPDSMAVEFRGSGHRRSGRVPAGMIDWCERSVSKAILGATLTSQADRGSNTNALGNVHNEVRKDLRDGDAKAGRRTLTRDLLYPIAALNGSLRMAFVARRACLQPAGAGRHRDVCDGACRRSSTSA